jgi:hypothetical protein
LYINAGANADFQHKVKFLLALEQKIGEQKIDVVFAEDQSRPVEQQAIGTGVLL